jgi:hypothetical protein
MEENTNEVAAPETATAPIAETPVKETPKEDPFVNDVKVVLKKAKKFPTANDIVALLIEEKLTDQKPSDVLRRVQTVIKNGMLAEELSKLVNKFHYRVPRRSQKRDSLGRAARRRLERGLLVKDPNAETFHACLKTTKDVSDAEAKEIYNYRMKFGADKEKGSWRQISKKFGLEYANGTVALNIFLRVKRAMKTAKKAAKAKAKVAKAKE